MIELTRNEILQAIIDGKQLQEYSVVMGVYSDITDGVALRNITHGKICSVRIKPSFQYLHYLESEILRQVEIEINRPENAGFKGELMEEIEAMFDRVLYVFFKEEE